MKGRVALVTGGASGIGRASALAFARAGAKVVVADRDEPGAKETAEQVAAAGGEAHAVLVDVTDEGSVRAMVAAALDAFGALHVAHNNAGVMGPIGSLTDVSEADARQVLDVNLLGVLLCMKHEVPVMVEGGGGAVVNTSSGAGLTGVPMFPVYAASKHGVVGLTRSAAMDFAARGVRVNAVCPGPVRTPMFDGMGGSDPALEKLITGAVPMRRVGTPEEVAELVVWLCSDAASYVTGAVVPVDGGSLA